MSESRSRRKARAAQLPTLAADTPRSEAPIVAPRAPRPVVATILAAVHGGQSLNGLLVPALAPLAPGDRAFAQALVYATLRRSGSGQALLRKLLAKPLAPGSEQLQALLLAALTELREFGTPPYAAVDGAVEAARVLGHAPAAGLVNAVLRRFLRERETLLAQVQSDALAASEHPEWLLRKLKKQYPQHWQQIVRANLAQAPMWLRVHPRSGTAAAYAEQLGEAGALAARVTWLPQALRLADAVDPTTLPGFAEGSCSVQDLAAQHAALLLAPRGQERILDACAAPGGKTAHLLELAPAARVTAVDSDRVRLKRVYQNLERLGLQAVVRCADVGAAESWTEGQAFDAILLDAPCSGTGVIRRHPDILWLRRGSDSHALAQQQRRLLDACWQLLKPGGRLLYATCSILPEENEGVVGAFMAEHPEAFELDWPLKAPECFALKRSVGRLNLPGAGGADGFYAALLGKREAA